MHTLYSYQVVLYVVESPERLAVHGASEENRGAGVLPGHSLPHGYVCTNITFRALQLLSCSFYLLTNWCQIKNEVCPLCIRAQKFQSSIT